ncbi:MAG: XdhC family protein, partial [Chloroflexi bacterium]|nr:XdhC family protein [Chloroflexota bacterium]
LGAVLDYEVTVIDDRARFATRERFPGAHAILVDDFSRAIESLEITPWTYLVLVTRGHEHDEATLQRVAGSSARYIGMIGSKRRVLVVFDRLKRAGVDETLLSKVYAPIGLDLGGRAPTEIALAIMAEIVNVRRRGGAKSLARFIHSEVGLADPGADVADEA